MTRLMFGLKEEHLQAIHRCFAHYPAIELAILYGSRAVGREKRGSDIDLTLIGDEIDFPLLAKIENELDDLLLPYKFDLSVKRNIHHPDLLAHIKQVGKVFYDKSGSLVFEEPPVEYKSKLSS